MATESGVKEKKSRNIIFRICGWFKATALELKKVTWPKFGEVMKKLGIVLGVVIFFFIALFIMDIILGMGHGALTGADAWWQFWS
ncbi:MAG: preprotein translocase subunit SecE [Firmicutes bacterium]|nr:preprotein translocase subunit SecE [Bacillota bacterium]